MWQRVPERGYSSKEQKTSHWFGTIDEVQTGFKYIQQTNNHYELF